MYSDVNSGRVAGFFDVAGRGTFGGARWTYRLLPVGDASQTVSLALDYKQYQNDVLFNGANQGTDVSALPVTVAYAGDWRQGWGKLDWGLDYAFNTPSGKDSSSDNYAANRVAPAASGTRGAHWPTSTGRRMTDGACRRAGAGSIRAIRSFPASSSAPAGLHRARLSGARNLR